MKKEKEEEDFWVCDGAGGAIPRKNEEGMRKKFFGGVMAPVVPFHKSITRGAMQNGNREENGLES